MGVNGVVEGERGRERQRETERERDRRKWEGWRAFMTMWREGEGEESPRRAER